MSEQEQFVIDNKHMGFDELARELHLTKDEVKDIWNNLNLGWHLTPRTLIEFHRLGHNEYEILNDVVVFIAPQSPLMIYKGTVTDFASIPRIFRWLIDKDDTGIAIPAIAHDMLYKSEWTSRRVADALFLHLMKYRRASKWKRVLAYLAVRLGGGFAWRKHDPNKVRETERKLSDALWRYAERSKLASNYKKV